MAKKASKSRITAKPWASFANDINLCCHAVYRKKATNNLCLICNSFFDNKHPEVGQIFPRSKHNKKSFFVNQQKEDNHHILTD